MSIIFGVVSRDGKPLPENWGAAMELASQQFICDHTDLVSLDGAILGCRQRYNTPQSPLAKQPVKDDKNGVVLLFDGRLDNREELAEELATACTDTTTDEELILQCYKKFGSDLAQHLLGDFAIALHDPEENKTLLVRDHMGTKPLYVAHCDQYFAFASHQGALLTLPWVERDINEQWIADYLEVCSVSHVNTIYRGITAVSPAHSIEIAGGAIEKTQYWELRADPIVEGKSEEYYVAGFRKLLNDAIACRSRAYGPISSEFSGGLDSSIITAFAKGHEDKRGQKLAAHSQVSSPDATEHVGDIKEEIECLASFRELHPDILYQSHCCENLSVIEAYRDAVRVHSTPPIADVTMMGKDLHKHMLKDDRRVLFSGWGGDQCATFRGNNWISDATVARDWGYLRNEFKHRFQSELTQKIALQIVQNPVLRWIWNSSRKLRNAASMALFKLTTHKVFHHRYGYPRRAHGAFRPDPELNARDRMQYLIERPSIALHAADSALGAAAFGVEYRYPLLDIRLLQFCLALPLWMHRKNGINRYISRQAMKDVVPDRIRFGAPKSIQNFPSSLHRELREKDAIVAMLKQWKQDGTMSGYLDLSEAIKAAERMSPTGRNNVGGKGNLSRRIMLLGHWLQNSR